MSQVWISKLIKLMLFCILRGELCRCGCFTASLHRCCSFNPSVSLVNIYVMLSDCLKSMWLVWLKNKTLQPNAEIPWEGWRQRVLIIYTIILEATKLTETYFYRPLKTQLLVFRDRDIEWVMNSSIVSLATKQLILTTLWCPPCLVPGPRYSGQY